jgi:hypothetical protein
MFTTHHIAKGFAEALMLTLISSPPVSAKPMWSPPAPIEYLQYDLTPYFNSMMDSESAFQYWRPNSGVASSYRGLFDYAPDAVVHASPMVEAAPLPSLGVPYIGYDMTPYYNLAPGCPLNNRSDDLAPIC